MASLAHVFIVNGERYLAIVFPLKYKNITSVTRIRILLVSTWIVTLLEAIGYTIANELSNQCLLIATPLPGLAFGILVITIELPFTTVIIMYRHIVIFIVREMRFMAKSSMLIQLFLLDPSEKCL